LEQVVAADPQLLGLDPYETGVSGQIVAIRQARLSTPTGRVVMPDVVILSESGHMVVVEAKLADNPELKDRRVVAQVVEYAASIANLSDDQALEWLGNEGDSSWLDMVRRWFPDTASPERLATSIRRRMRDAEIHLVIVCDGAPEGLRDLVRAVAGQAALGAFRLHVVELVPYVAQSTDGVLLISTALVRTEIVARTAITISYEAGAEQPAVSVVASSTEEVEQAIAEVRAGGTLRAGLAAVVAAYDADAPEGLRTIGRAASYRQVRPPGWPVGIHYEFMSKGREHVGVELHVESKRLLPVSRALPTLLDQVRGTFAEASHDPNWNRGMGRLVVLLPVSDASQAAQAAQKMTRLIAVTRDQVSKLLADRTGNQS
jgi:hypothetical protein